MSQAPYVIPDIQPFTDNTGTHIGGRAQWRDHLKRNNLAEFGVSDIEYQQSLHEKRRREAIERVQKMQSEIVGKWTETTPLPESEPVRNRLWCKVAERIEGREPPTRKQLIRITLEELRRQRR